MSIFEIEGKATKEVTCDVAAVTISFNASGSNTYDISRKVMEECDSFLEEIVKIGIKVEDIHLDDESISSSYYRNDDSKEAVRKICFRIPYDVMLINEIRTMLQEGKYEYDFDVKGEISNIDNIKIELSKEALKKSREEAEQLAGVLGIKVKGVKSIQKGSWRVEDYAGWLHCEQEIPVKQVNRISNNLSAEIREESVTLKVSWIMEA